MPNDNGNPIRADLSIKDTLFTYRFLLPPEKSKNNIKILKQKFMN